ncbi:uncharacterized protein BP5553_00567 [Venustampulla echinocandica]|uniref:Uncharacterized protein n=1 Tax=Venustampulla echinocandica TaxID=2656787 RepID=A0A370TYK4_9HELO|nr:uncharacterized protein BP5553_00567 [Venustampulla echinocandica]RDL40588.1 hypothetical protein BP5553_00567 [Venustampulla echinocandica]
MAPQLATKFKQSGTGQALKTAKEKVGDKLQASIKLSSARKLFTKLRNRSKRPQHTIASVDIDRILTAVAFVHSPDHPKTLEEWSDAGQLRDRNAVTLALLYKGGVAGEESIQLWLSDVESALEVTDLAPPEEIYPTGSLVLNGVQVALKKHD